MRSLRQIRTADWQLLVRAGLRLLLVRLALWLLPFGTVRRLALRRRRTVAPPQDPGLPRRAAWAVAALGRRLPAMTCLVQAIALESLLSQAGHAVTLRIGVRRAGPGTTSRWLAHAWVEQDGQVLLGNVPDLTTYAVLTGLTGSSQAGWVWQG
jgi:hypothetical protein